MVHRGGAETQSLGGINSGAQEDGSHSQEATGVALTGALPVRRLGARKGKLEGCF